MPLLLLLAALALAQTQTDSISIDQFGYRPDAKKFAVISAEPGSDFEVVNERGDAIFSGTPTEFNGGAIDAASGNKIWHFDFSSVKTAGKYYILDKEKNLKSFSFAIANDVYNDVLKNAVRMLYYQRAGIAKEAEFAGTDWADGVSFSQDAQSRLFSDKDNAATEKDLSGGWFDAGDYNKYTKWTADYVENLLLAFEENPEAFTDDYGIPESGNGVPDILDEVKWGLAWLLKMQNSDGSLLSVQGLGSGSPPSSVTRQSLYGPANATATFGGAKAFAIASRIFGLRGEDAFAEELKERAIEAFDWGEAHRDSIFHNNSEEQGSKDLAAGDQEQTDSWDRVENRITAALYLYEITNDDSFLKIFEDNWVELPLHAWSGVMQQYRHSQHMLLMKFLTAPFGDESVKTAIRNDFKKGFAREDDFGGAYQSDGYRSFIYDYQWGSNKVKADYGLTFYKWNIVEPSANYADAAEDYLHYIHGVNPLNIVYLTNMNKNGSSKSLTSIYHTWFADKSEKWDITTASEPGPAPGYLAGGANNGYKWDACCDNQSCGGAANNAICTSETLPIDEPPAKMYKDFNTSWPLNSWEISEPSNGYQISYIRLLSKFVEKRGGNLPVRVRNDNAEWKVSFTGGTLIANALSGKPLSIYIYNSSGKLLRSKKGESKLNTSDMPIGLYIVKITDGVKSSAFYYPKSM